MASQKTSQNPLLEKFNTEHGVPPFHLIKEEHYEEAMKEAIARALKNIDKIVQNPETPNFKNTIEALESSDEDYYRVSNVFEGVQGVLSTEKMQELSEEFAELSTNYGSEVLFNKGLFERIKFVFDNQDKEDLTAEQKILLKDSYDSFVDGGALLSEEKKEKLKKLFLQVSSLTTNFQNNMVNETQEVFFIVDKEEDLKGIPEETIKNAKVAAKEKDMPEKWLLKSTDDVVGIVLTFAENRDVREKYWRMYMTLCQSGKNDNHDVILKILHARHEIAEILGYKNHAELTLKDRMAKTPDAVFKLLDTLTKGSLPKAKKEIEELKRFALKVGGIEKLEPWDSAFYSEKLKKEKFGFDTNDLRPYYELNNVLKGVFTHFEKVYGLDFKQNTTYPVFHEDVMTFDLFDKKSGKFLGVLYADFFARDAKQGGAWANCYREGGLFEGSVQVPIASITCNFEKASEGPSLLTHNDVLTIFHEMGHAMHLATYKGNYRSLSGFNVKWDFVELPSQLMEKWAEEKELLHSFAKHYETGELMPDNLIRGLKESSLFMNGIRWAKQAAKSNLDMQYHTRDPKTITDLAALEEEVLRETTFLPRYDSRVSTTFDHVFAGAYSAGYYSYAWADVLVADAYEYLVERELYDQERGLAFRDLVLSVGASLDEMDAYRSFRGKELDGLALLRQEGLLSLEIETSKPGQIKATLKP